METEIPLAGGRRTLTDVASIRRLASAVSALAAAALAAPAALAGALLTGTVLTGSTAGGTALAGTMLASVALVGPSGRRVLNLPRVNPGPLAAASQQIYPSSLEGSLSMTSLLGVPLDAAYHLITGLTAGLTPVLGGFAAAAAIVLLTIAVRLLVLPLSLRALRTMAIQARLAPRVQELRRKHGKQPERLQRELTSLYKSEGTSMFAALTPVLLQWPAFSVLYLLFRSSRVAGRPNSLLSHRLFGVPLGAHWLDGAGVVGLRSVVFVTVFVLLAVACWLLVRVARAMTATPPDAAIGVLGKVLPYITVLIAAFAPLAAGIYLVTSTAWSVLERYLWSRGRTAQSTR